MRNLIFLGVSILLACLAAQWGLSAFISVALGLAITWVVWKHAAPPGGSAAQARAKKWSKANSETGCPFLDKLP